MLFRVARREDLVEESLRQSELVMAISLADLAQILDDCAVGLTDAIDDAYDRLSEACRRMVDGSNDPGGTSCGMPEGLHVPHRASGCLDKGDAEARRA